MRQGNGKRVYIVDDDKLVRDSTHLWLSVYGYAPRSFSTPTEFLGQLPHLAAGCALIDLRMPVIDGLQILEQYGPRLRHLAVIIMTGHTDADLTNKALELGAFDLIEKPFKQNKLIEAIEAAFLQLENPGDKSEKAD